jgi:hypothetical protein
VERKRVHLMTAGKGVAALGMRRKLPHLYNPRGVHSGAAMEQVGISVQLPHLGNAGIYAWMTALSDRLRRVRVCCGDWRRVLGPAGTTGVGLSGVFLDPPYTHEGRDSEIYTHDGAATWEAARIWSAEHGADRRLRIVLCGYSDAPASVMPPGWTWRTWKANGGYGNQGTAQGRANAGRECLFFSPGCLAASQPSLFDEEEPR